MTDDPRPGFNAGTAVADERAAFEAFAADVRASGKAVVSREIWHAAWTACSAALAAPKAEAWQPIETAPRDGTAVLVMRDIWPGTTSGRAEECNGHNTYVAEWWAGEGDDGKGRWVCYMDAVFDPTCPIVPTHWMPLPAPPATDG